MNKKIILSSAIIVATFFLAGCSIGNKDEDQNKLNTLEEQNKQQQEELEKLKSAESARTDSELQAKKDDCQSQYKTAQDNLSGSQERLAEFNEVLAYVEANNCPSEKTRLVETVCTSKCLKDNYGCSGSSCDDYAKKDCKKQHEDNIVAIEKEINEDVLVSVKNYEVKLESVKNECSQYLN